MDNIHVQNQHLNVVNQGSDKNTELAMPYAGPRWLVEERDACGVGFIANCDNQASHELIVKALSALTCLEHRGGCSADQDSGDGAGLMTAIPWDLFSQWFGEQGIEMPAADNCGVGMVFLPPDAEAATKARQIVEKVLAEENLTSTGLASSTSAASATRSASP
jgi:glutamate synthase (ferredoxin)